MNNAERHFSQVPTMNIERSKFDRSNTLHTAFSTGEIIPLYVDECLPGDSFTMDFAHVTRMATPIAPVMDNAALDVFAFYVPNRLIWEHWREFWGENNTSHWEQPVKYQVPYIESPSGGWDVGSLADYLGIPVGVTLTGENAPNVLKFRAYCKIWNDWFRSTPLKDPVLIHEDETILTGVNKGIGYDYTTDTEKGAAPLKAAKWHDYFTSALPEPQLGQPVNLPLGLSAPVKIGSGLGDAATGYDWGTGQGTNVGYYNPGTGTQAKQLIQNANDEWLPADLASGRMNPLIADLSQATAATINQLRAAFAVQRFYEALARGGNRYTELVYNIFHVTSPDARQQRSEYLGGCRLPINIDQVLQTSATDSVSPQGNTSGYSVTVDAKNLCTYSATEHGIVMILGVIRTNHTYSQGMDRMDSRRSFTDFYLPQFAHLGEQEVRVREIYAQGNSEDKEIFGYQERWAEYRYKPNKTTGKMRPGVTGSLAIWHYGDYYTQRPYLSGEWIDETEANVARTLAVQNEPQWIVNTHVKAIWTRPMPMYSVPGLLDHF